MTLVDVVKKSVFPIEAVTVCINYSDHLKYCITNKNLLDRWIIITTESDLETIELCKLHSLEYIFSRTIFENSAEFAKGKAINEGLSKLNGKGWILVLDCDTVLPFNFRQIVDSIKPTPRNLKSLFGARGRRLIGVPPDYLSTRDFKLCQNAQMEYFKKFKNLRKLKRLNVAAIEEIRQSTQEKFFDSKETGTYKEQWSHFSSGNWENLIYAFEDIASNFLGYFQLFHSSHFTKYPESSTTAETDDLIFAKTFLKRNRSLLELDCVHIGPPALGRKLLGNLGYLSLFEEEVFNFRAKLPQIYPKPLVLKKRPVAKSRICNSSLTSNEISTIAPCTVWGQKILNCRRDIRVHRNYFRFFYSFNIIGNNGWFFSMISTSALNKSKCRYLCFDLKLSGSGLLEIGYGNAARNKSEWHVIETKRLLRNQWSSIQIKFDAKSEIHSLADCLAIRGRKFKSRKKLFISEIYFKN
jgi:hypothetical protein